MHEIKQIKVVDSVKRLKNIDWNYGSSKIKRFYVYLTKTILISQIFNWQYLRR